jgi:hypothetical protein
MDTIELRAATARLLNLHERFAPCFGRRECQKHSLGYLRGLLLADGRKSVEPMGHTTRRDKQWSPTQVARVLSSAKNLV